MGTADPSQNLDMVYRLTTFLALKDCSIESAPDGCTPIILVFGDIALKYVATPAAKAPAPTGMKI